MKSKSLTWSIISLGFPMIVGQLGIVFQSFADTMMVGQYGTMELSASGFVNNMFNMVIFFMLGISYSTIPIVGALFGRRDYVGTARSLRESLLVNITCGFVVALLLLLLYVNLDRLGQPEELLPLIRPYLLTQIASLPFLAAFNSMKQFSDALGRTRTPMWILLTSNVLNVVLNYLLIYGKCGLPEMGLLGAGVATFLARTFLPLAMSVILLSRSYQPFVRPASNASAKNVTRLGVVHLLSVGFPIAIQLCLEASAFNITALFMGWLGAIPLAAHQVMGTVSTLCFQILYGVGGAASILVSQYRGQNDLVMVQRTVKTAYIIGLCCAGCMTTLIVLAFRPLVSLFTTSDEVVAVLLTMLPCFVVYQFGDCTQILFANVLRGLEAVKRMMLHAFIAYIVVSIPLSYVFAFVLGWGSAGVWWGFPFGLSTAGLLFWLEYRRSGYANR
ncbi:MAG: MATE family efflux transporter [Bacteroidaceae bacterium]|nr:MATE family efflux transporter [Bacteroidaceae bacterium]